MSLRERQRGATREQIIDAVHAVLSEEHPATLSMPQVAARAGISLRTLYRYFPTKEALVDAASETFVVPSDAVGGSIDLTSLRDYLRLGWSGFGQALPAVRAQHVTPAGRALRAARTPRHRAAARRALQREGLVLSKRDAERIVDLAIAMSSSAMYLELVDRLGRGDEEAADLASWAVEAIIDRARREGAVRT